LRYIPAHTIASWLSTNRCAGLPFFHAITGCDIVSSFCGRYTKLPTYDTWKSFPTITPVFCKQSTHRQAISDQDMEEFERLVVLVYGRTYTLNSVNDARQTLVAQISRIIENRLHLLNTSREPPSRQASSGCKNCCPFQWYQVHVIGEVSETLIDELLCGSPYLRHKGHDIN